MKLIRLLFSILFFVPLLLYGQGSYSKLVTVTDNSKLQNYDFCGTYFDGSAWIFYPSSTSAFTSKMRYIKVRSVNGQFEKIPNDSGKYYFDFPFTIGAAYARITPTTVVLNGILYLFYTNQDDYIVYTKTDGETWSNPVVTDITAKGNNLATTVKNGKIFLLKQNTGSGIKLLKSVDGKSWETAKIVYQNSENLPNCSLSLTSFYTEDGKEDLLLSINRLEGLLNSGLIETRCWNFANGFYNVVTIPGAIAKGASLIQGRIRGGESAQFLPIKCIIHGTDDKYWIAHFNPNNENSIWNELIQLSGSPTIYYNGQPAVVSNFESIQNNGAIQKYLYIISYNNMGTIGQNYFETGMGGYKLLSETLERTETVSSTCDDKPSLWSLIGVIEGPPPYVLNGENFSNIDPNDPVTSFTYGTESSTEIVNTTERTITTSTSLSVPVLSGLFNCGIEMTAALNYINSKTYSQSYSVSKSVNAGEYSLGYYLFEKPTITRYKYEAFTPGGYETNEYQYVFAVTGSSLITVDFPLTSFNSNDITSYLDKVPDQRYPRISEKGFQWAVQSPWESEFSVSNASEYTSGSSIDVGIDAGAGDIFSVSANYEISLEETHTTTFGESVTINLNNPNPRSGHTEDIKAYSGVAYWLKSADETAYWIPTNYEGHNFNDQRPWCITWSVKDIKYNDLTDVNDEENLPTNFELFQNYPNPFNPSTTINYQLPKNGYVVLKIYNMLGEETAELVNEFKDAGHYNVKFDANKLTSGMYLYKIQVYAPGNAGEFSDMKKMLLIK